LTWTGKVSLQGDGGIMAVESMKIRIIN